MDLGTKGCFVSFSTPDSRRHPVGIVPRPSPGLESLDTRQRPFEFVLATSFLGQALRVCQKLERKVVIRHRKRNQVEFCVWKRTRACFLLQGHSFWRRHAHSNDNFDSNEVLKEVLLAPSILVLSLHRPQDKHFEDCPKQVINPRPSLGRRCDT
jgi:hypothetical protein